MIDDDDQRRKPWGTGDTPPPQNFEWGTPMYNVPQILTFSLYFSLILDETPYFCSTCKTEIVLKLAQNYAYRNPKLLQLLETKSPDPLPGLRSYTPLGDFCPQTPCTGRPPTFCTRFTPLMMIIINSTPTSVVTIFLDRNPRHHRIDVVCCSCLLLYIEIFLVRGPELNRRSLGVKLRHLPTKPNGLGANCSKTGRHMLTWTLGLCFL